VKKKEGEKKENDGPKWGGNGTRRKKSAVGAERGKRERAKTYSNPLGDHGREPLGAQERGENCKRKGGGLRKQVTKTEKGVGGKKSEGKHGQQKKRKQASRGKNRGTQANGMFSRETRTECKKNWQPTKIRDY